jgi:cell division protein ZapE
MTTPLELYRRRTEDGALVPDGAQLEAIEHLDRLHRELIERGPPPRGWRRNVAKLANRRIAPVRGLYLWGDVGRGKTLLMDLFYACLPFDDKLRQHFHRFMSSIHDRLKSVRHRSDPLDLVADALADETRIICFDEFVVTDIADAMILGNLFAALFSRGVTLAATSNTPPRELYRDGLQRTRFLPAIARIEAATHVVQMTGAHDYRLRALERADIYQCPADERADQRLAEFFDDIAPDEAEDAGVVEILGRPIEFRRSADGVVWFDFSAVCEGPRSQDDYIELSRCYQTVLVSGVPQFDRTRENEARRFIALVDEFYDRRVKLILSADVPVDDLYRGYKLVHDFKRTRSRLEEMQSHDYLATAHRP